MSITNSDKINVTDSILSSDESKVAQELAYGELSDREVMKHILKSGAKGFAKYTIFGKDDTSFGTPNLVLLSGREFLAQKLADVPQTADIDHRNYKIRYFGYGSGGAQEGTDTVPNKMGPFDDDSGLYQIAHFHTGATDAATSYKYIDSGRLKSIRSDYGKIAIEQETHTINKGRSDSGTSLSTSVEVEVDKYTAIKYTMFIMSHEFGVDTSGKPFAFNEAALYAVDTAEILNEDGVTYKEEPAGNSTVEKQEAEFLPFARFTTSTKWIEEGESLKIEWFILV